MNNTLRYSLKLGKNRLLVNMLSSFILAFIVCVIIIASFFFNFSIEDDYLEVLNKTDLPVVLFNKNTDWNKTNLNMDYLPISDNTLTKINQAGAKVYPVYNIVGLSLINKFPQAFDNVYQDTIGVAIIDESYLLEIFANNSGVIEYVYNGIKKSHSVYVTDYFFDVTKIVMGFEDASMEEFIMAYENKYTINIGAIIKTNYEEKHQDLFDEQGYINKIGVEIEKLNYFFDEVFYKYGLFYSTNENYIEDYLNFLITEHVNNPLAYWTDHSIYKTTIKQGDIILEKEYGKISFYNPLEANEIWLSLKQFNEIFETNYFSLNQVNLDDYNQIPIEIEIIINEDNEEYIYRNNFYVTMIGTSHNGILYLSTRNQELKEMILKPMALILPTSSNRDFLSNLDNYNLIVNNNILAIHNQISDVIHTFSEVFNFIKIILIVITIIIIVLLAINTSRKNKRFIGIMKCFGARINDLTKIFLYQTLFNILVISIFIVIGTLVGTTITNNLLETGISNFLKFEVSNLNIIKLDFKIILFYLSIAISLFLASIIFPIFKIKKTSPIEIVKPIE